MGFGRRLTALVLSLVVALGSVCYKPPEAEAAIIEGMVANMFLSAYMTASGISLVPDDKTSERLGEALESLIPDFVTDYAAEVGGFTVDAFNSVIEENCVIQTTGLLQIGHLAAALMGRFTAWLIDKFGLVDDAGNYITDIKVLSGDNVLEISLSDGSIIPVYPMSIAGQGYAPIAMFDYDVEYTLMNGIAFKMGYMYPKQDGFYFNGSASSYWIRQDTGFLAHYCFIYDDTISDELSSRKMYFASCDDGLIGGACRWTAYYLSSFGFSGDSVDSSNILSVSLAADYEAAPSVDEQYAMVVDTGLTFEDEQSYIDAVLSGVAAGTLSPTYTIEETTTGDVTVPDEGEDTDDTQAGILDWTKKIWQSVKELPRELMDALTNVFVPSAEYTAALPQMVVDTFDSRSGFLTYPFSVLADFIGRLDDTGDDWIITWPDIDEPFSGGRLISKGQFNVSQFVRSDLTLSNVYSIWMLITKGYLIFLFLELCHRKYKSVVGDRLE